MSFSKDLISSLLPSLSLYYSVFLHKIYIFFVRFLSYVFSSVFIYIIQVLIAAT